MKLLTSVKWEAENNEEGVPSWGDPSRMEVGGLSRFSTGLQGEEQATDES